MSLLINIYKPHETVLLMALLKALCWASIFILRIRFPPGTSIATALNYQCLNSQRERCDLLIYYSCEKRFSTFFRARLRLFRFMPP